MSLSDLITARFTFGPRFNDPQPVLQAKTDVWMAAQLAAPAADDPAVLQRLNGVQLPITFTTADGTQTTQQRGLIDLFKSSIDLWAIQANDTSTDRVECVRAVDEVAAARWVRGAFSPWQVQEVMVDFWHNHFSVNAYDGDPVSCTWPLYDRIIRAGALGNFRVLLGAIAKSPTMMVFLNQNQSVADHPNENFAREVMELHTLGIINYLGVRTPPGAAGTGYSDDDVINAARVLTGWTIDDDTGNFIFQPRMHDFGAKVIFGQTYPANIGQAEGERFLDSLAAHPGTAQYIATKLYTRFVQDVPPAGDPLISQMAWVFQQNVNAPDQIARVLSFLAGSPSFAASAGQKIKTPFEMMISTIRATGAEIDPQMDLYWMLESMGAPMFGWPTPNGMPDVASAWTGTNDMVRRWTIADQITAPDSGFLIDGPSTLFTQAAVGIRTPNDAVAALLPVLLGSGTGAGTVAALQAYATSHEVLGAPGAITTPSLLQEGLRRLVGGMAAIPEFQIR